MNNGKVQNSFANGPKVGEPLSPEHLIPSAGRPGRVGVSADEMRVTESGALVFTTGGITTYAVTATQYTDVWKTQ